MKRRTFLILSMASLGFIACGNALDEGNDLCQLTYDCTIKNCDIDEDEGDINTCKGKAKKNLVDCKQTVEQNVKASEYLPKECRETIDRQTSCNLSSFVCHENKYYDAGQKEVVTQYSVSTSFECQILDAYVEKACTPEEEGTVIKLIDEDNKR